MVKQNVQQELYGISATAQKAGISRATVYNLNRKYHFIYKLGSRSLIRWTEFEQALMQEMVKAE